MTVFQVNDLSLSFQGTPVFSSVSVNLGAGKRAGIVGPNGAGKTSLLRTVLGEIRPDLGSIDWSVAPRIGYVPQKWEPDERKSPLDLMGYDKVGILGQCGIGKTLWDLPCANLSGGERTRLSLALALASDPDLLILDEPTNHLDIPGIEWLEKMIRSFGGSVLVVSHDRSFLDAVATEVWELRETRLTTYPGNYSAYLAQLRDRQASESREYAKWQRRVRELSVEIADRRRWYEKAHDDAGINDFLRRKAKKHARQFKAKEKMLDKTLAAEPLVRRPDPDLSVSVAHAGHRTRTILRARDLEFSYDRTILDRVDVSLGPKDKVGLIGSNGAGKTTLIRLLLGDIQPKAGSVWLNPDVRIGYLSQMLGELDPGRNTADNVRDRTGLLPAEARNLLGRMGITGDTQLQALGTLSMGERTRVAVSCLCFGRYDALVLDEPTNHLDANARDCVEEALSSFPGALLVATHDRYFLDRVCNAVWSLESGNVRAFKGTYSQLRGEREAADSTASSDNAIIELTLQAEIAYLVSRISASKDQVDKADLEHRYTAALEKLKALRGTAANR